MKVEIKDELGKSDFSKPPVKLLPKQKITLSLLLVLAFLLSVGADIWPGKKTYFWSQRGMVTVFDQANHIKPAHRYNRGHSPNFPGALYYLLLVKFFLGTFSQRMLTLRMISVASSLLSIFFLYLIARYLFCRLVALILVFLLSTSPIYLESMRAYGYVPFSMLVFVVTVYVFVKIFNNRLTGVKLPILAFLCFMSLALYVPLRLVMLLIVLFYLCYFKTEKKKLLAFAVLFLLLIVFSDAVFRDTHFDWGMGLAGHPEWFKGKGPCVDWRGFFKYRLIPNVGDSVRYLINWGTIPFADEDSHSRLFNYVYTPFLFLGIFVCLWRRKRSHILLLLWFGITFFSALPSSYNSPRRIVASLPVIYLFIALGLYLFFQGLSRISIFAKNRLIIIWAGIACLSGVGIYDICEYMFVVSKPYYNYSHSQLKAVADFINGKLDSGAYICCNFPTRNLIWGNPYFINHFREAERASPSHPRLKKLKETILWALEEGNQLVYLYTFPQLTVRCGPGDYIELFNDIDYLKANRRDGLLFSKIPGTEMHYVATVSGKLGVSRSQ